MKKRIIFVMNRWDSSKGGIQTVNRELLLAIAKMRPDIDCISVVTFATAAEVSQAYNNNITLIHGRTPDQWEDVLLSEEIRTIDQSSVIAIVGHSHFSAKQARLLQNTYFKNALIVQFVHMDPMRTEGIKEDNQEDYVFRREAKQETELSYAKAADIIFCIGPKLTRVMKDNFCAHDLDDSRIHRIDCGISTERSPRNAPPKQPTVVCIGRTESIRVKGLDIFARAAGILDKQWDTDPATKGQILKPRFIVRGAEKEPERLQQTLQELALEMGGRPELIVRPYTTDKKSLHADLRGATTFLMPSREEGFGLVACEAISFGVPIIVSRQSGIAELISETSRSSGNNFDTCIVDTQGDAMMVSKNFASTTFSLLVNNNDEFFYPRLRAHLSEICSWKVGAETFISVVEKEYENKNKSKSTSSIIEPKPSMIENVLESEKESLMQKHGVVAVGIKQAIIITIEKGTKPNLPEKIEGFEVIVREVENVKLTSAEPNSSYELLVDGQRRATIGLFGTDFSGQLFAITVGHAIPSNYNSKIEMLINNQHIPLVLENIENQADIAILRVNTNLSFLPRSLGYRKSGTKAFIEMPSNIIEGQIDSVDITIDISTSKLKKHRYKDVFEVALKTMTEPGVSGAVVSDQQGDAIGIVIGSMINQNGKMSLLALNANSVMSRNNLNAVAIDDMSLCPHIGILLENDEIASELFQNLYNMKRFTRSGRLYFYGITSFGIRVTCTIQREFSSVASAIAMTQMLLDNRPDAVFVIGTCLGLQNNQHIGDIIIASELLVFEAPFELYNANYMDPYVWVAPMKIQKIAKLAAHTKVNRKVYIGSLASANMVIKATDVTLLETISRSVIALDIGAAGAAVQAAQAISKELPVVVISVVTELFKHDNYSSYNTPHQVVEFTLNMLKHIKIETKFGHRNIMT